MDINIDSQLQDYLVKRQDLISQEKSFRHDYAFRQSLSPTAKKASQIVSAIRKHEASTVWTKETEEAEGDVYPGMMFTLAKERMEGTKLWEIVRRMPKGCMLHAHIEAMVEVKWLFDTALKTPGMHISSSEPLTTPSALQNSLIGFQFLPTTTNNNNNTESLYSPSYSPSSLIPILDAADSFPETLPSNSNGSISTSNGSSSSSSSSGSKKSPRERFLEWLTDRSTITPEESLKHHEGINLVWKKFASIFRVVGGIIYYEPIYREFIQHLLHSIHKDNILWMDIRSAFVMNFQAAHTGHPLTHTDVIRVFTEEVAKYKASPQGSGFWGSRMIWTTIRSFDRESIVASMRGCVEAKKAFPETIAGFDLVGQEDMGRSHKDMLPELLWFKEYCKQEGVEIPYFFHAGETLGDGNETDENLFDAVLLGTKRIGHGFSLYKHPHLLSLIKSQKICIEVCPISNEILRLTSSISSHSLPALLAHGVPVSLSNDDPGILGQSTTGSLTHDYWQVLQAFDNVGLEGLGDLAETGVRYAAFCDDVELGVVEGVREVRLKEWREEWEGFCRWICETYGEDWGEK